MEKETVAMQDYAAIHRALENLRRNVVLSPSLQGKEEENKDLVQAVDHAYEVMLAAPPIPESYH